MKYCENDVKILYDILIIFAEKILTIFRIDVFKYPTLTALTFAIYRSRFLKRNSISISSDKINYDFRKGYTGGSVDV
jgi:hypothetical protein